jgi:hypothetical protein
LGPALFALEAAVRALQHPADRLDFAPPDKGFPSVGGKLALVGQIDQIGHGGDSLWGPGPFPLNIAMNYTIGLEPVSNHKHGSQMI